MFVRLYVRVFVCECVCLTVWISGIFLFNMVNLLQPLLHNRIHENHQHYYIHTFCLYRLSFYYCEYPLAVCQPWSPRHNNLVYPCKAGLTRTVLMIPILPLSRLTGVHSSYCVCARSLSLSFSLSLSLSLSLHLACVAASVIVSLAQFFIVAHIKYNGGAAFPLIYLIQPGTKRKRKCW